MGGVVDTDSGNGQLTGCITDIGDCDRLGPATDDDSVEV